MNDRQVHLEHFERQTHRVCEKPFVPGVLTNACDLDKFNEQANGFASLSALAFWSFVGICLGLFVVVVSMAIGWLLVVL